MWYAINLYFAFGLWDDKHCLRCHLQCWSPKSSDKTIGLIVFKRHILFAKGMSKWRWTNWGIRGILSAPIVGQLASNNRNKPPNNEQHSRVPIWLAHESCKKRWWSGAIFVPRRLQRAYVQLSASRLNHKSKFVKYGYWGFYWRWNF